MLNVAHILEQSLAPSQHEYLRLSGQLCTERGVSLFLVGGTVRDLFLDKSPVDLDLSAVGGEEGLATDLARALLGEVSARSQFGTAKIRVGDITIDLALARKETYERPGALPSVTSGSIHDDLARRDFSMNAVAVSLDETRWGELADPHGGHEDIKRGLVRVLHPGSFVDDATRILRAVRYAVRLGFSLETETETLMRRDLSYVDTIGGDRVRNELARLFQEARAVQMLEMAQRLGVLAAVYPPLEVSSKALDRLDSVSRQDGGTDLLLLSVLAFRLPSAAREGFVERLNMDARWACTVRDTGAIRNSYDRLAEKDLAPSELFRILDGLDIAAVRGARVAVDEPGVTERLRLFDDDLRQRRPVLNGDDLIALGFPEGPKVGDVLDELMTARLDGLVTTRDDEVRMVTARLERENLL